MLVIEIDIIPGICAERLKIVDIEPVKNIHVQSLIKGGFIRRLSSAFDVS